MTPAWQAMCSAPPGWRRVACYALAMLLACSVLAAPPVAAQPALERKVKAAFLYKFLGYTEFPAAALGEPGTPVVIGVAGADEMAAELARVVAGRSIHGRAILVRSVREGEPAAGLHLLFVGGADAGRMRAVARSVQPGPMLLVSEADNGLQQGSVINFKIVEERVRFDVSLEAADRHQVKLSSRLLSVANHVHKGAP